MNTKEYITTHIEGVRHKLLSIASKLVSRAYNHDSSKLKEPEYSLWCKMDQEPRYKYGTKEYKDKVQRYKEVFDLHYTANSHHPEHHQFGIDGMDLIDLIEMTVDWISYKKEVTIKEAIEVIEKQSVRYNLSEQLQNILKNTIFNHFSTLALLNDYDDRKEDEELKKEIHFIDIKV